MDKIWKAKWITAKSFYGLMPRNIYLDREASAGLPVHKAELKNVHMLARKEIMVDEPVEQASIDITADDYYKLYVNGHYVAEGPAPGYFFHYYYNRHSIAPF